MMFGDPPDDYPPSVHSDLFAPSIKAAGASGYDLNSNRPSSDSGVAYYSPISCDANNRNSCVSADSPPSELSPWNQSGAQSPFSKSPWSTHHASSEAINPFAPSPDNSATFGPPTSLVGSLVREEGHIYSLAARGELLYTGSDSKNIRVWKNQEEFAGFKCNSGLVKAIVISCDHRIFTGHQDGKIRVWKVSSKNPAAHKRAGTLPKLRDYLMMSFRPSNYVEVRRNRNALWIKHHDAISCLCLSEDHALLYSGSWDKAFKVWRISDSKCLESVNAHDDAVNAVVAGFDGLVFTGSADGTVKVWRREVTSGGVGAKGTTRHAAVQTLLTQESAVTALAVSKDASILYCGSSDGLVNFWEREKHLEHGGVLRGHKLAVLCLSAAGNLVLSGSADKTICIWRREGGAHSCLSVLSGHTGPVKCLAVETDPESKPDDTRWVVYSGSLDKSVKVWKVSELAHDALLRQYRGNPNSAGGSSAADLSDSSHQSGFSSPNFMG